MIHYKAKPTSRKELSNLAHDLRASMGLEYKHYFPIIQFIEKVLPIIDPEFDYEIVEMDDLPEKTYALTYPDEKKMKIRADVYEAACQGQGRARFTLAHELCHYLLHDEDNISFARGGIEVPKFMDTEWQANTFAAELLAPGYLIRNMSIEEISQNCGISYQCARIQSKMHH